jgi:hypothetical protein
MNSYVTIFTVASWEPRFRLGLQRLIQTKLASKVVMYFSSEYSKESRPNRDKVRITCTEKGVILEEYMFSFRDFASSWKLFYKTCSGSAAQPGDIIVDITTMPREVIWILLNILEGPQTSIYWAYHKPVTYDQHWLSRDPGRPRLVPKMGGITRLGMPTRLLLLSGFDLDRAKQLILFYEPELTLMGIQSGVQFDNQSMNAARHRREFERSTTVVCFDIDAYSADHAYDSLKPRVEEHVKDSNLIMTSLGPKPTSVALYRLHRQFPGAALAYAPSNEYNPHYSEGLGDTIFERL